MRMEVPRRPGLLSRLLRPMIAVRATLRQRSARRVFLASLAIFLPVYMVASGIIFKASPPLPTQSPVEAGVAVGWPIGVYPWVVVVFFGKIVFSMNLTAGISALALSLLFASNMAVLAYARKLSTNPAKLPGTKTTLASAAPAMFSTFACCGGGLSLAIFSYTLTAGIGSAYAAAIVNNGWLLALASGILLYWNLYRASNSLPLLTR